MATRDHKEFRVQLDANGEFRRIDFVSTVKLTNPDNPDMHFSQNRRVSVLATDLTAAELIAAETAATVFGRIIDRVDPMVKP